MSGGISFNKEVYWGKAGWCYRAALDGICDALRGMQEGSALADEITAESHPAQWCQHLEIDEWSEEKRKVLFEAIYRSADRFKKEGPAGWLDPSFFPGFLRAMEELVQSTRKVEAESDGASARSFDASGGMTDTPRTKPL